MIAQNPLISVELVLSSQLLFYDLKYLSLQAAMHLIVQRARVIYKEVSGTINLAESKYTYCFHCSSINKSVNTKQCRSFSNPVIKLT